MMRAASSGRALSIVWRRRIARSTAWPPTEGRIRRCCLGNDVDRDEGREADAAGIGQQRQGGAGERTEQHRHREQRRRCECMGRKEIGAPVMLLRGRRRDGAMLGQPGEARHQLAMPGEGRQRREGSEPESARRHGRPSEPGKRVAQPEEGEKRRSAPAAAGPACARSRGRTSCGTRPIRSAASDSSCADPNAARPC